jgi:hypothetical protein
MAEQLIISAPVFPLVYRTSPETGEETLAIPLSAQVLLEQEARQSTLITDTSKRKRDGHETTTDDDDEKVLAVAGGALSPLEVAMQALTFAKEELAHACELIVLTAAADARDSHPLFQVVHYVWSRRTLTCRIVPRMTHNTVCVVHIFFQYTPRHSVCCCPWPPLVCPWRLLRCGPIHDSRAVVLVIIAGVFLCMCTCFPLHDA